MSDDDAFNDDVWLCFDDDVWLWFDDDILMIMSVYDWWW